MEIKKSDKANLEKEKTSGFLIGLIVGLAFLLAGFEWNTIEPAQPYYQYPIIYDIEIEYPSPEPDSSHFLSTLPPGIVAFEFNIVEDDTDIISQEIMTSEDDMYTPIYKESFFITKKPKGKEFEKDENAADAILTIVEEMPEFPGGHNELMKFIKQSMHYPIIAQENDIQGRVVCQFIINQDGSISDAKVLRGVEPSLDAEAIRIIKTMPNWNPGKHHGEPVRVQYVLPIVFRLQ